MLGQPRATAVAKARFVYMVALHCDLPNEQVIGSRRALWDREPAGPLDLVYKWSTLGLHLVYMLQLCGMIGHPKQKTSGQGVNSKQSKKSRLQVIVRFVVGWPTQNQTLQQQHRREPSHEHLTSKFTLCWACVHSLHATIISPAVNLVG